jgi:hypothetical protein
VNLAERDFAIREVGCICCRLVGKRPLPTEKHHLLTTGLHGNGKRRGEHATIGLCSYHHRGSAAVGTPRARSLHGQGYGPTLADQARAFRARFGSDEELLTLQNQLLQRWQSGNV